MNCTICGKSIVLSPSAAERSKSTGLPASHFTKLFTAHTECQVAKRSRESVELMRRINAKD